MDEPITSPTGIPSWLWLTLLTIFMGFIVWLCLRNLSQHLPIRLQHYLQDAMDRIGLGQAIRLIDREDPNDGQSFAAFNMDLDNASSDEEDDDDELPLANRLNNNFTRNGRERKLDRIVSLFSGRGASSSYSMAGQSTSTHEIDDEERVLDLPNLPRSSSFQAKSTGRQSPSRQSTTPSSIFKTDTSDLDAPSLPSQFSLNHFQSKSQAAQALPPMSPTTENRIAAGFPRSPVRSPTLSRTPSLIAILEETGSRTSAELQDVERPDTEMRRQASASSTSSGSRELPDWASAVSGRTLSQYRRHASVSSTSSGTSSHGTTTVLADLGRRINSALNDYTARSSRFDEKLLDSLLKEICSALLESDVNVKLVANLRNKVKAKVLPQLHASQNVQGSTGLTNSQRQLLQKAVFDELVALVDPGEDAQPPFQPKKGKTNVVMFVGLQGSGKTTSCTKLAVYYQRRGFKTCLVCADTFRAGAFDQLKQNATKAKIPFFGSYTESDPVAISAAGVAKFRAEKFDIIIVDTSGRHRQESELFKEMVEISETVQPSLTIMVLDGAIGQAAESQSRAFKEAAGFAAIIVTKMDGHAKGGGAISAVAATKTPIMFIGTGEHLHDLEKFSPGPFISKMLGMGDLTGLMEHVQDMQAANGVDAKEKREEMMKKLEQGVFTIRDMRDQLSTVMSMGPLSKLANMIPGMGDMLNAGGAGGEEDASKRLKRLIYIMDAMTTEELDSDGKPFQVVSRKGKKPSTSTTVATAPGEKEKSSKARDKQASTSTSAVNGAGLPEGQPRKANRRVIRVARGSGTSVREVEELLAQHQMFAAMVKKAGGKQGWMAKAQQAQGRGSAGAGGMPGLGRGGMPNFSPAQLQQAQQRMASMGMGNMDLSSMMKGLGGGGGMPDMASIQKMAASMGLGGMMGGR